MTGDTRTSFDDDRSSDSYNDGQWLQRQSSSTTTTRPLKVSWNKLLFAAKLTSLRYLVTTFQLRTRHRVETIEGNSGGDRYALRTIQRNN